jgi:hypothetical protein
MKRDYPEPANGRKNMRVLLKAASCIIFAALTCLAQQNDQPIPARPVQHTVYIESGNRVSGLDQLVRESDLIIDATIGKVLKTIHMDPREPKFLETYTQISVNKVIRGELPKGQQSLAINEFGGDLDGYHVVDAQNSLVQPGERYILFLEVLKERKEFPVPDLGMPIYSVVGISDGKIKISEKETVQRHPSSRIVFGTSEGSGIETFLDKLHRVLNIVDQQSTFPQGGANPPDNLKPSFINPSKK